MYAVVTDLRLVDLITIYNLTIKLTKAHTYFYRQMLTFKILRQLDKLHFIYP
jgi:hypothetical protein